MISPCTRVCALDQTTGYCLGCGRTGEEIAGWTGVSDEERRRLMAILPARLAALGATASAIAATAIAAETATAHAGAAAESLAPGPPQRRAGA